MDNDEKASRSEFQELVEWMKQLLAAQILAAYYQLLSIARIRGDKRGDEEIFRDCMADFVVMSQTLSRIKGDLSELDPEELIRRLRGPSR
jgi:hypothetical protein